MMDKEAKATLLALYDSTHRFRSETERMSKPQASAWVKRRTAYYMRLPLDIIDRLLKA